MKHMGVSATVSRPSRIERLGDAPDTVDLLTGDRGIAGVSLVRARLGPGREGAPPHRHPDIAEWFCVLGGAVDVLVGDEILGLEVGDTLDVPPTVVHAFGARPGSAADLLVAAAPGNGRADYFRLLDRVRRGLTDRSALMETGEAFGNDFTTNTTWARHRGPR